MAEATIEIAEQISEERAPRPQWELAECTCPDYCERDHELDYVPELASALSSRGRSAPARR